MNWHRHGGGSDNACRRTLEVCRARGHEVFLFERDSRRLATGARGKVKAFTGGLFGTGAVGAFQNQLDSLAPDVVHVHELYPYISPWILPRCSARGVPVVMTVYDYRLTCPVATHFRDGRLCHDCLESGSHAAFLHNCRNSRVESLAFALRHAVARKWRLFERYVDHFIVLTRFSRDWLVEHAGIAPGRISVIPCIVDLPEQTASDPASGEYVFFAGRFVREKGVEELIAACRLARVPLRLAGKAPSHPAIGPGDQVECVLNETREELDEHLLQARVAVVPSQWYETFGLVAAEASAMGIPCVATRLGALQETVLDGQTGLLVPPGDVPALAGAIRRIWDNPELARALGREGRAYVAREFNEERHAARLEAVYARI